MHERLYVCLDGDSLYAPETTVPVGAMRQFPVVPALARHVAQVAVYRETLAAPAFERVIPDGAVRLVFDLGARRGCADIAGPSVCPVRLRLDGEMANLTVTLRPGTAAELLAVPLGAIKDQCIPLGELWPSEAEPLAERLRVSLDDASCSELVQAVLAARLARSRPLERRRVVHAQRALAAGCTVRATAEELGIGERRLQQIFKAQVGLSPRQFRRLARIHACLRSLRQQPRPRWSELALEHSFFDQAHLSNEFSSLVGLTPTEFVARISDSSKTTRRPAL